MSQTKNLIIREELFAYSDEIHQPFSSQTCHLA